jgi:hypothetical protein
MTARSTRRAAQRRANKLARKAERNQPNHSLTPLPNSIPSAIEAEAQQHTYQSDESTETPKTIPALDTVPTPLTGGSVLLPEEDAGLYQKILNDYERCYRPIGAEENALVQSLADINWRLSRIPRLEMSLYALGRAEFAGEFDEYEESRRPALMDVRTFLVYERQLRSLQLQEARLVRRREKETAELRRLQKEREQKEKLELEIASKLYLAAQHDNQPFEPADHGFEFSIDDIESYIHGLRATEIASQVVGRHF